MKIDLARTDGTSPPTNFLAQSQQQIAPLPADEQVWTVAEVAAYLKMSPRRVLELTRRRSQERSEYPLPCFKIHSKCLRFRKSDVQQWLHTLAQKARVQ
jgi:predicted DNA-binding transcriptional regulator AlpA